MPLSLIVEVERFPIAGIFRISRESRTEATVVTCTIGDDEATGRGECVPYKRYGETLEGVVELIESLRSDIASGITRRELMSKMPAGAARNAIDCALWDLEAKRSGKPVHERVCRQPPRPVTTAYTISLGEPEVMATQARAVSDRPLLKVKVGGANDAARVRAVAAAAPNSRLIVDANEGWNNDNIQENLLACAHHNVALVEQPLPAGKDAILRDIPHAVPICADESLHIADDLDAMHGLYDAINIKLDKTGGLTAALELREKGRELGFSIMIGCMVGTSLAMAPGVLLAQDADFVDLDGPLMLKEDRVPGLSYSGALVSPPDSDLWG